MLTAAELVSVSSGPPKVAGLDQRNRNGKTPLMVAVTAANYHMVTALVKRSDRCMRSFRAFTCCLSFPRFPMHKIFPNFGVFPGFCGCQGGTGDSINESIHYTAIPPSIRASELSVGADPYLTFSNDKGLEKNCWDLAKDLETPAPITNLLNRRQW